MEYIFGNLTFSYVISALLFMSLGIAIVKIYRFLNRKKGKVREEKTSFFYWVKDNYLGILAHLFIALLLIRFTSSFVSLLGGLIPTFESEDPMFIYSVLGFNFQTIIDYIQKKKR